MKGDVIRELVASGVLTVLGLGLVTEILWVVQRPDDIDWRTSLRGQQNQFPPHIWPSISSFFSLQDESDKTAQDQQPDEQQTKDEMDMADNTHHPRVGPLAEFHVYDDPEGEDDIEVEWTSTRSFSSHPYSTYRRQRHPADDPICIGMIVKNVWRPGKKGVKLRQQFFTVLRSILRQSRRKSLHFVFLTDPISVPLLDPILKKYLPIDLNGLSSIGLNVTYDFFDVQAISRRFSSTIRRLKPNFTSGSVEAAKYRDDLFMIGPFYHLIFPFRRFIMLDIDLKFRIDIQELDAQFDLFEPEILMGVGLDLSPHYRHVLRYYREQNPGTHIGEPGRFQGLNTGVVLFDFEKMRTNVDFNRMVMNHEGVVDRLSEKYIFKSHLGDQCLFTLLALERPEWFHVLPCEFNYQLDTSMMRYPFLHIFQSYHNCTASPKIYHGNGGFEIPEED
ncbi:hypothetical protein TCAL_01446 [Tigriopus californicus]|uniref:Xyloside xylosyltransferase 1 n=1 Tax=Tigriopus californicus TaxID=6832 RepID=A0A553N6L4_TIGCA|nr:xyloside xylosyltransferase 1-like [Tigriopus californicus]TRY61033.1 hypothetical protein TCAL_01446 [Tigriopus californicus]|eukprot:TCALIF_01446-PA protein Name:"Similar to Xxylt1 Xyloside xylosyltransferase 1 (Mus musculus)" AED:0.28 eAED:0.28 QI:400/1/0.5/1/0/0.5/2/0/445